MPDFFFSYPYLFSSIISIVSVAVMGRIFLFPFHNKLIFMNGLINLTCFTFSAFLEGCIGFLLGCREVSLGLKMYCAHISTMQQMDKKYNLA